MPASRSGKGTALVLLAIRAGKRREWRSAGAATILFDSRAPAILVEARPIRVPNANPLNRAGIDRGLSHAGIGFHRSNELRAQGLARTEARIDGERMPPNQCLLSQRSWLDGRAYSPMC
jgi:hypothetical protein